MSPEQAQRDHSFTHSIGLGADDLSQQLLTDIPPLVGADSAFRDQDTDALVVPNSSWMEELDPSSHEEEIALRMREKMDPEQITQRLRTAIDRVTLQLVGFDEQLTQSMYAFMARDHQLLTSTAGVAKSLMARSVFGIFSNANIFSIQLTKGTPEEALVGPLDFKQMKKGKFVHLTEGYLPEAHFAFLDEFFDGNDVALRAQLGILNERLFQRAGQNIRCPLLTAIATTNYLRETDVTQAILDRFPFRSTIVATENPYDHIRIDWVYERSGGTPVVTPDSLKVSRYEMAYLADVVEGRIADKKITAHPAVLFLKNAVVSEYLEVRKAQMETQGKNEEPYLSPRTRAKLRDVLNASALINGRTELTSDDLDALKYGLVTLGQSEEEEAFATARKGAMKGFDKAALKEIPRLVQVHAILEQMITDPEKVGQLPPTRFQALLKFLGIKSVSDINYENLVNAARSPGGREDKNKYLGQFRKGLFERIVKSKPIIEHYADTE